MRLVLWVWPVLFLGAAVGCAAGDGASPGPTPTPGPSSLSPRPADDRLQRGPAYLEASELTELETYPPQYLLTLRGSLPTPCHEARARVERDDASGEIRVEVYSLVAPDRACAQVLAPFEGRVPLGAATRRYQVLVNGAPVGAIGP